MKKVFVLFISIIISGCAMAQMMPVKSELPQPFQGGSDAMTAFFKDSLQVTPTIKIAKASGMVVFKFTADTQGTISKIVVYYADDLMLTDPVIDALKRTNGKWVIPSNYKSYDFILPFSINYKPATAPKAAALKAILDYQLHRKAIVATNQIPLNAATLLPTVVVNY